jgi:hypothetical protein
MGMQERNTAENVVKLLKNFVAGDEPVGKVGARLLKQVLEDKALDILKQKYSRQGVGHLAGVIQELLVYEDGVARDSLKDALEGQGEVYSKKTRGRPKKDEGKGQTLYEAFAEAIGDTEEEIAEG